MRAASLFLLFFASACTSLQFHNEELVSSEFVQQQQATKVTATFEVYASERRPLSSHDPLEFQAREDGVLMPSESQLESSCENHPVDLVILIDTSHSMYEAGLISLVKNMVRNLQKGLKAYPHKLEIRAFANDIGPVTSIENIPEKTDTSSGKNRWNCLYHALGQAMDKHPEGTFILFTDGADNYSQNHGIVSIRDIEKRIQENKLVVHATGFANVGKESDLEGISGRSALARLARNGRFIQANLESKNGKPAKDDEVSTQEKILAAIVSKIRATYTVSYYSPHLSGQHKVSIEGKWKKKKGRSKDLLWGEKVGEDVDGPQEPTAAQPD